MFQIHNNCLFENQKMFFKFYAFSIPIIVNDFKLAVDCTNVPYDFLLYNRVPVALSIQGLWVRIPARPTLFPTFDKSHCDMRHSSSTNGLSLCGKAASCLRRLLCGVLVCENQETYEKVNWPPWYDTVINC